MGQKNDPFYIELQAIVAATIYAAIRGSNATLDQDRAQAIREAESLMRDIGVVGAIDPS